jgi:hypothetical protein
MVEADLCRDKTTIDSSLIQISTSRRYLDLTLDVNDTLGAGRTLEKFRKNLELGDETMHSTVRTTRSSAVILHSMNPGDI